MSDRREGASPAPADHVLVVAEEVREALAGRRPVVALETTIFSSLGLPAPANREALDRCFAAIRAEGAVPALTCVLDGRCRVGLDDAAELDRILAASRKCAERELPVAVAQRWEAGVTTVSASVALAAAAGVHVFATGGIGGVHRDDHLTGDVSADLGAISRHPVITVTSGAKAFLDLKKTVEAFETLGVPLLGLRTDRFPAFYVRDSGIALPVRIEKEAEAAAVLQARLRLGLPGGVVVANPIPAADELDATALDRAVRDALADAVSAGVRGSALTPFVLGRIAAVTGGRSVPANLALAEDNARVAARIARAWADANPSH